MIIFAITDIVTSSLASNVDHRPTPCSFIGSVRHLTPFTMLLLLSQFDCFLPGRRHADTTWADIVRNDNSTYHVADYDIETGELVDQGTVRYRY